MLSEMVYCFSGVRLHVLIRARILAAVALLKGLDMYELDSVCAAVISSDTSKGFVENSNTEFCSDCERVSGITFSA